MMEKRLKLAKKLLNPDDSVLIVTIDEKEYLHLGCLLEELFPEARMQMVSSVISPRGAMRQDMFTRVEEYIYFVFFGKAAIVPFGPDMLMETEYESVEQNVWKQMIRGSENGPRTKRPKLFYPIFFNLSDGSFNSVGNPPPLNVRREDMFIDHYKTDPVTEACVSQPDMIFIMLLHRLSATLTIKILFGIIQISMKTICLSARCGSLFRRPFIDVIFKRTGNNQ